MPASCGKVVAVGVINRQEIIGAGDKTTRSKQRGSVFLHPRRRESSPCPTRRGFFYKTRGLPMKGIPLSRGMIALVDDSDFGRLAIHKWQARLALGRIWYASRSVTVNGKKTRVSMHREILGVPSRINGIRIVTDHINGNGLDNRRSNLRSTSHGINIANSHHHHFTRKHNLPRGVVPHACSYRAQISMNGKTHYLGSFKTPEDASRCYCIAKEEYVYQETLKIQQVLRVTG